MSENAVLRLEEMLPEIVHFEQRGVFTKEELTQIMARRRKYEYAICSRVANMQDFLSYINHEIEVETQRRKKYESMNIKKSVARDFAIVQRIHTIYNKCLMKFSSDIGLWVQYIQFCTSSGSSNQLNKALVRAITRHPRVAAFRILAADREFQQGGLLAARKLLMRAIRIKTDDQCLIWQQLFKLECAGIHRVVTSGSSVSSTMPETGTEASVGMKEPSAKPSCQPVMVVFNHALADMKSSKPYLEKFTAFAREAVSALELSILGYPEPQYLQELQELVNSLK